jgi:hypothetical protein
MKKLASFFFVFNLLCSMTFAQAKKPTIMVLPSDDWCIANGLINTFENQGKTIKRPDYERAFQENSDLVSVISKIGELMKQRGFPLVDAKSTLDKITKDNSRNELKGVNISAVDKLNQTAKPDITLKVFWKVNEIGPKKSIEFRLQGIDAYSVKQIAAASGTGPQSFTAELSILLEEAVLSHLDNFNSQLMSHFEDLQANGREGALVVLVNENATNNLNTVFTLKGKQAALKDIINRYWMPRNTVQGRFSMDENSENVLKFSQVRISLYGDDGWGGQISLDFYTWAQNLATFLKDELKVNSEIETKGLGEAEIIIK